MKLTPSQIIESIVQFWKKLSKRTKIIGASVAGGIALLAIVISFFLNAGNYVVLYSGLASDEAGEIAARISEMSITPKVGAGGTILVPKENETQLKMELALEGYPKSALNYDIFSNNSGLMTTDYEKKQYLVFQLQNRLQDSIKTISAIDNAIVTISLPNENTFVLKEDQVSATASVVLDIRQNITLTGQQIKGIEQLVAKSIPGLDAQNIAIVDSSGNILNNQYANDSEGIAYTKIDLEKSISSTLESKIMKLLQPLFGANAVRVSVNATVDINKTVSESTQYSPVIDKNGVVVQQDMSKETIGGTEANGGVPGSGTNTGVDTYPQTDGTTTDGNTSESSSTSYLVNELKEQVQRDGYEIKDISVAVLIGSKELTQEQISAYKEMVSGASGIEINKVVIANAEFVSELPAEISGEPDLSLSQQQIIIVAVGGFLILVLILIPIIVTIRRKGKKGHDEDKNFDDSIGGLNGVHTDKKPPQGMPQPIVLNENKQQATKRQIQELASTNPDIVAQLLRTWIREDE